MDWLCGGGNYHQPLADHIAYFIAMCIVYYFLQKYVANSVRQLMERSVRSCLFFAAIPLLYYLFDYATTVYTELLYTGAPVAVQFTPSAICTFYLVFVLLYYNEAEKTGCGSKRKRYLCFSISQCKNRT